MTALQTIATISAERFEGAVDRIILDSHDLPAVYRSALMFNLWLFANECATDDDRRKEFGLEIMVLDRIKNKCAIAVLEQAEEIPVGLALRLLELSRWSFPSLNEDDDPDWPANRRMKARLWLALMEKVRAVIDPDWDPKDRPRTSNIVGTCQRELLQTAFATRSCELSTKPDWRRIANSKSMASRFKPAD